MVSTLRVADCISCLSMKVTTASAPRPYPSAHLSRTLHRPSDESIPAASIVAKCACPMVRLTPAQTLHTPELIWSLA